MTNTILRSNAVPVYEFLSLIESQQPMHERSTPPSILDCGAGGAVPPLALFAEHGFDAYGIDISDAQLERARQYCEEHSLQMDFRHGDMRHIPFEDNTFDYVYEHYAMCHLSHAETAEAIAEMYRVLKPGGLCFLGVISLDSWPKPLFGVERAPGEFWNGEGDDADRHTMFTSAQADSLMADWDILSKQKRVRYLRSAAEQTSLQAWMDLLEGTPGLHSEAEWRDLYPQRNTMFNYAHTYYFLKKAQP